MRVCFLLLLLGGCASSTAEYVQSQTDYDIVGGYVKRLDGLESPKVRNLKDGKAYTVTTEGCVVVLYSGQKNRRTRQYDYKTFELKPGDQFVSGRPLSFVLVWKGKEPPEPEPVFPR